MGVTTADIFGTGAGAQPATPGSYGEAPRGFRLPDATRLGAIHLQVAGLARSLAFYEQVLGLCVIARGDDHAQLAAHGDDRVLVALHERKGARPAAPRGALGLYHFAILLPDRPSLGHFVRHLGDIGVRAGAGDHLVSEAFYLQDPDGLGIEVYADRPRDSWRRIGRELMMSTDRVDVQALLDASRAGEWAGMPAGAVIGHVHLHVGDLAVARDYFSEAVGFDRTVWSYPGALFLGAGGYHHHLGTNTWAGSAARPPAEDDARLLEWTIELPDAASVTGAAASIEQAGYAADAHGDGDVLTRDPWGTSIRLRAAAVAQRER